MTTDRARSLEPVGEAPVGREAVVAAVLDSAADLFVERGPAATSIRDIAERAGVNHGLVFRHFGSKEKLVARVLDHLASESLAAFGQSEVGDRSLLDARPRRHLTVLARSILDGYPVATMQQDFPVIARLIERARPFHGTDHDASLAVAHVAALELGWQLFGPFLRGAANLGDMSDAALQDDIDAEAARIFLSDHAERSDLRASSRSER
ncbi:TetR/AcrR family transcriptional regulator [Nocardia sp. NEAU-G5]|uniref:TetR/AcrR family transcriptional regulator n=1 Tax=Nocardia albiluteola TaxID=2842303 RepID=A0ABS6B484_9NOCA|nr:TetR/AcrR family transcriptional regulator [Nocardia albiluteola]MBU3065120.1 TetR/AcrR family transcriptional regulator [Nocardia albiluteola]